MTSMLPLREARPVPGPDRTGTRAAGRFRPGSAASTLPPRGDGVNPKKAGAVAAILTTRTYRAAAKAAGVGERTLRRWRREDPEFRGLLRAARMVHRRRALRGAWRAASAAAGTLADLAVSLGRPDRIAALEAHSPGALVNDLWATIRTSERVLELAGLLEAPDVGLRREVRRLEARVAALERRGGGER